MSITAYVRGNSKVRTAEAIGTDTPYSSISVETRSRSLRDPSARRVTARTADFELRRICRMARGDFQRQIDSSSRGVR